MNYYLMEVDYGRQRIIEEFQSLGNLTSYLFEISETVYLPSDDCVWDEYKSRQQLESEVKRRLHNEEYVYLTIDNDEFFDSLLAIKRRNQ